MLYVVQNLLRNAICDVKLAQKGRNIMSGVKLAQEGWNVVCGHQIWSFHIP